MVLDVDTSEGRRHLDGEDPLFISTECVQNWRAGACEARTARICASAFVRLRQGFGETG
jgi:hypothetical protein